MKRYEIWDNLTIAIVTIILFAISLVHYMITKG